MSSFEEDISAATFAAFAVPAQLAGEDVDIIVERNVEVIDGEGNIRFFGALVHMLKSSMPDWDTGALVTSDDEGNFNLYQVAVDDGYIVKIDAAPNYGTGFFLLLENGSQLLLENGTGLLLEA